MYIFIHQILPDLQPCSVKYWDYVIGFFYKTSKRQVCYICTCLWWYFEPMRRGWCWGGSSLSWTTGSASTNNSSQAPTQNIYMSIVTQSSAFLQIGIPPSSFLILINGQCEQERNTAKMPNPPLSFTLKFCLYTVIQQVVCFSQHKLGLGTS